MYGLILISFIGDLYYFLYISFIKATGDSIAGVVLHDNLKMTLGECLFCSSCNPSQKEKEMGKGEKESEGKRFPTQVIQDFS